MLFGCCTSIENYELLVKSGYDRIILSAVELMSMDEAALSHTRKALEDGPIKCRALNSFCPPALKLCGEGYDTGAVETYGAALCERAHALGVEYIGIGAPKSRSIPDGYPKDRAEAEFRESLDILCRVSRPYGIAILLEAVCSLECNYLTTTDEAAHLVKSLKADNLALVFDTYHAFMMGEDAAPVTRAMDGVKLVHVAQDIGGLRYYLNRGNMGEYKVFFDALLHGGYDGEVSVEAFCGDMASELGETLSILKELCSGK